MTQDTLGPQSSPPCRGQRQQSPHGLRTHYWPSKSPPVKGQQGRTLGDCGRGHRHGPPPLPRHHRPAKLLLGSCSQSRTAEMSKYPLWVTQVGALIKVLDEVPVGAHRFLVKGD
ncbi:hypothetical protein AUP68_07796 [Ilyonectria robusta]